MKVFMSWSGQRSKATAELLHFWVKCVVQASQPWISTRGIDRGALWFSEINNELKDTTFGIICLTQENKNAPWILFEAGALAKGLASNRVCTFLVDLETKDIRDPLAQFNHTLPNKEGLWNLVLTLNASLEVNRLELRILEGVFETYWPQFEDQFKKILDDIPVETVVPPRSQNEILDEILESTRNLTQRIRHIEERGNSAIQVRGGRVIQGAVRVGAHMIPELNEQRFNDAVLTARKLMQLGESIGSVHRTLVTEYAVGKKTAKEIMELAMDEVDRDRYDPTGRSPSPSP